MRSENLVSSHMTHNLSYGFHTYDTFSTLAHDLFYEFRLIKAYGTANLKESAEGFYNITYNKS